MRMSHNNTHQNQGENVSVIDSMGSFLFLASQFVSYLLQLFWYFGRSLLIFLPRHRHHHWGAQALNNKTISFHSNQAALPTLVHLFKTLHVSGLVMPPAMTWVDLSRSRAGRLFKPSRFCRLQLQLDNFEDLSQVITAVCIIQGMRLFILRKNKCLVNSISPSILDRMIWIYFCHTPSKIG